MTQAWIAVLMAAGVVLAVDQLTMLPRRRARRMTVPPKPFPEQEESYGSTDGEIAV